MSSSVYASSQVLKAKVPGLTSIMSSSVNERLTEYDRYMKDLKAADNDLRSLQVHCDRTLRRLFREIPKPSKFDPNKIDDGDSSVIVDNENEDKLKKMKSSNTKNGIKTSKSSNGSNGKSTRRQTRYFKQHRNVRVFGEHYVAANSDEHICRAVPAPVREGIVNQYIHYLTLTDTMNWNTRRCHRVLLPRINVEFEESERKLKDTVEEGVDTLQANLSAFFVEHKAIDFGQYERDGVSMENPGKPQLKWNRFLET